MHSDQVKYIFFGNAEFSTTVLEKLISAGFTPGAVICGPDRPVGRKMIITSPPVKLLAQRHEVPIWQPESLKTQNPAKSGALAVSSEALDTGPRVGINIKLADQGKMSSPPPSEPAEEFAPSEPRIPTLGPHSAAGSHHVFYQNWDLFIVAAYPKIIPREILDIPRRGTIGVHPSLLPRHRGASPIQTAILEGDKETGTTLFLMDEKVDHGPILAQKTLENYELGIMNYEKLSIVLANLSANLLIETLPKFLSGGITPRSQDESKATYAKKFKTEGGYIEPVDLEKARTEGGEAAAIIDRKIRALNPEPGVWTLQNGTRTKLLAAKLGDGKLKLLKIQKEGKNSIAV
ncbi:hypothetical protein HY504_01745 [Candidatus Wolfebacteria bacterium]|nr:hypothetical protein [Candidatus Wolfebacteria bacterium]